MIDFICNVLFNSSTWMGAFTANLFSEALVTVVLGILIFKWIEKKERTKEKKENQKVIASMIASELEHNREQLRLLIQESPKGNLVFPALETSVWDIIDKPEFLNYYKPENLADILNIYRRTKTINEMYNFLLHSSHWVVNGKLTEVKKEFMDHFVNRCKELLNYLDNFFVEIDKCQRLKRKNKS